MFNYTKEITNFFIDNPYLFADVKTSLPEYIEYFFPNGHTCFRIPYLIDTKSFTVDYKKKIVQTFQLIADNNALFTSIYQISKKEHIIIGYTANEEKLCSTVSLHVDDPSGIPIWMKKLREYEVKEKETGKTFGFAQFVENN